MSKEHKFNEDVNIVLSREEYIKTYSKGFEDGFNLATKIFKNDDFKHNPVPPLTPPSTWPWNPVAPSIDPGFPAPAVSCQTCHRSSDISHMVCNHPKCPSRITC
jgi:hypothetical protein